MKKRVSIFCLPLLTISLFLNAASPSDVNYDEAKVPNYSLPALLPEDTGAEAPLTVWNNSRRDEIVSLFEQHIYGKKPEGALDIRSEVVEHSDDALNGIATRRQVVLTISPATAATELDSSRSIQIELLIYTPNNVKGRVPAFIGLNFFGNQTVHEEPQIRISQQWMRPVTKIGIVKHRATEKTRGANKSRWQAEMLVQRGYGLVTAYYGDIDPDNYKNDFTDGVHPLFYKRDQTTPADDEWGAISAWAWGLSTMRNWLEADDLINAKRMAVIGHSRLGKTALWAGARDKDFAMVISNNSGCGGAALYRRAYGERVHNMVRVHHSGRGIGYWFCKNHAQYARREFDIPVDQHMIMALVAPRPLYVASAEKDQWADPKGEYLSAKHASEIYKLYGTEGLPADEMPNTDEPAVGRIGYHIRSGEHNVTEYDWRQYLAFADRYL